MSGSETTRAVRTVRVAAESGLHARPANEFVEAVNRHDADVRVARVDNESDLVDAGSTIAVASLGVRQGESVKLVVEGEEPEAVIDALERVLSTPQRADEPNVTGRSGQE
ncbi:HPr family phosphocarrier protein [Halobium salinum]|uniref:HPr family phosphocarrier protein n=1 Tax=Halobium salinum TaxID=1364940 RepID=A0ABD5PHD4_9EURY|nr:HPr family phosphocarrier protein [Halobium salinum]